MSTLLESHELLYPAARFRKHEGLQPCDFHAVLRTLYGLLEERLNVIESPALHHISRGEKRYSGTLRSYADRLYVALSCDPCRRRLPAIEWYAQDAPLCCGVLKEDVAPIVRPR